MTTPDIRRLYEDSDALALAAHVRRGDVTAAELVEVAIAAIERVDPVLNTTPLRTFDLARGMAAGAPGDGPFAGVPFLLKNIGSMWQGTPLTNGMRYLDGFVCDHDTEMVVKMRRAGLIPLGRSNTPEGGWSIGTEPRAYGPTRNPWDPARTPGGSSGGAAAAVAARAVPLAEASDGGGSIRVPAALCGLVGLKPSRGRITYGPRDVDLWFGSIATFAVTRTVRDTAAFLDAVAGGLIGDPYTPPTPDRPWLDMLADEPRPLRIGLTTRSAWGEPTAPEVRAAIEDVARRCADLGHAVEPYAFTTDLESAWRRYNEINAVETAADFDRLAAEVGRPVAEADLMPFNWALLQHGRSLSGADYARSIAAVRKAGQQVAAELARFDVALTPVLTQPARPVGYWSMEDGDREAYLDRWADAAYMFAFNMSGLPAMSVPAGFDQGGVPIGVQLVGRYGREEDILGLAAQLEELVGWPAWRPAGV